MKKLSKQLLASAVLLAATALTQAQAANAQLSYTFSSGDTLLATFSGALSGDTYSDISNVHAWFDGTAVDGGAMLSVASYLPTIDPNTGAYALVSGGASISSKLKPSNFLFNDVSDPNVASLYIGSFTDPTGTTVIGYADNNSGTYAYDALELGHHSPRSWQVTALPVPEPTEAAMLALGLGALVLLQRRRKA